MFDTMPSRLPFH